MTISKKTMTILLSVMAIGVVSTVYAQDTLYGEDCTKYATERLASKVCNDINDLYDNGIAGIQGETGPQGIKGDPGNDGVSLPAEVQVIVEGVTGEQGPQGIQGMTGIQGIQGVSGQDGAKGEQGVSFVPVTYKTETQQTLVPANQFLTIDSPCNEGDIVLSGYFSSNVNVPIVQSGPTHPDLNGWTMSFDNTSNSGSHVFTSALCLVVP